MIKLVTDAPRNTRCGFFFFDYNLSGAISRRWFICRFWRRRFFFDRARSNSGKTARGNFLDKSGYCLRSHFTEKHSLCRRRDVKFFLCTGQSNVTGAPLLLKLGVVFSVQSVRVREKFFFHANNEHQGNSKPLAA